MLKLFTDFIRNEIVAPILGIAGAVLFLYLIAKYGNEIFAFLMGTI